MLNGWGKVVGAAFAIITPTGSLFYWGGQRVAFEESAAKVHEQIGGALASQVEVQNKVFGEVMTYIEQQKMRQKMLDEAEECVLETGRTWQECLQPR